MRVEKAIEILTTLASEGTQDMELDDYDAIKLGIEALKAIPNSRHGLFSYNIPKLPGETEE